MYLIKEFFKLFLLIYPVIIESQTSHSFRTSMDKYAHISILAKRFSWLSKSELSELYKANLKSKTTQEIISNTTKFYCDTQNGPGRRSLIPPNNVNQVRPGDIDIIAAIGDSISSGNAAISTSVSHMFHEFRDISWSIGGRANWRKYLTLPNILKEFNPSLYGFSVSRSLTIDRGSRFNVAEAIVMSSDLPYQARVVINRMKADPKVDMEKHWKLLTIFVGNTDLCTDSCHYVSYEKWANLHERDLIKVLRILRDNVPRMIVNIVSIPNFVELLNLKGKSLPTYIFHRFVCTCLLNQYISINDSKRALHLWYKMDEKVALMDEFHTQNFTVVIQPFFKDFNLPKIKLDKVDMNFFATDRFHFSQKGHSISAKMLWNNMLQPLGKKDTSINHDIKYFLCPTAERPYIATRGNNRI